MEKGIKILRISVQLMLGLTFVVSGVLKAMDIYGTELKLIEYANSTGLQSLAEYNMPLSVMLCAFEIFLGLWLMIFIYRTISLGLLVATTFLFTGTIIYLMINPEKNITDCGCFGEILPMGISASFLKNIVILMLATYLLWSTRNVQIKFNKKYIACIIGCLFASLLLPIYTANNLSLYNPTGYGEGENLRGNEDSVVLDDNFENVTDTLLSTSDEVYIFVLKQQPTQSDEFKMKDIWEKCNSRNAICFSLAHNEYKLPNGINQYYADVLMLKSLVRSKDNGVIVLKNRIVKNVHKLKDF